MMTTTTEKLWHEIRNLPRQDFSILLKRMEDDYYLDWDMEIEHDLKIGKLDKLLQSVKTEIQQGHTTAL